MTIERIAAFSLFFPFLAFANGSVGFVDIDSSPYGPAIEYGRTQGIVQGYADGTFQPLQTINRAEFTKIIVETYATNEATDACLSSYGQKFSYPDAPQSAWYGKYLCIAHQTMEITGYPDRLFRPAQEVNFAEAAKMLANAATLDIHQSDANFLDSTIWYRPYTQALARLNAIPPTIDSYNHLITRGEMMEMIYRLRTENSSLPMNEQWLDVRNTADGFSFQYPSTIFVKTTDTVSWPFGQNGKTFPGMQLVHTVPVEHCGLSGLPEHCTPLTQDMTTGFFVIPESLATVKAQADSWQTTESVQIEGRTGFRFTMGVEGENTYYTFLPLTGTTTLMVTRDGIDERILRSYQNLPAFIPATEQTALFEKMMDTLHFFSLESDRCRDKLTLTIPFYSESNLQNADFQEPVRVSRCIDRMPTIADASLRLLFGGPTQAEKQSGARMSNDLQDLGTWYLGVSIKDDVAIVNFKKDALAILNSAAARQLMAKAPISMTLLQFSSIKDVRYAIDGKIFEEWDA